MQENYAFIADAIDTRCRTLTDIADAIWDRPETRFEEFWSAERLASELEAEGFTLTARQAVFPMPLSPASAAETGYRPAGRIRRAGRAKPAGALRDGANRHAGS
jgi:metal-dependent amidase/aminoacylase/carboxypeptidase family protein